MAGGTRQRFGRYMALDSHLHRLDPVFKVLIFGLLLAAILVARTWLHLAYLSAYVASLCALSKVNLSFYLGSLKYFAWMFALSLVINVAFPRGTGVAGFSLEALQVAGIFSSRLVLMILAATVMTVVTSPSEIGDTVLMVSKMRGKMGRRAAEFASLLSISMRFVPVMFEEAERIRAAQMLRGRPVSGLADRVTFAVGLIVPLMDSSLRRAGNLGYALEARCYGYGIPTSPGVSLGTSEILIGGSTVIMFVGLLLLR
jgi:energy-coupling factor transport system permease protein